MQMPRLLWARVSIEPGREAARLVVEEWEIPRGRSYWTFVEAFAVEHSQSLRSLASSPLVSSYPLLLILQDLMNQKA